MNAWRLDLTVFTDLSASLFAACFMILLIFLHLAQAVDAGRAPPRPVEARTAFRLVERAPLPPAAMLDLLRRHRGDPSGVSIDLFADRVELTAGGTATPGILPAGALGEAAREGLGAAGGDVRLYVLSPRFYDRAIAALDAAGLSAAEITVPRALGDGSAEPRAWRSAFTDLEASAPTPEVFRAGLARILEGGEEPETAAAGQPASRPGGGGAPASAASASGLLERIADWLARLVAGAALAGGFGLVALQERRRIRLARGPDTRSLVKVPAST